MRPCAICFSTNRHRGRKLSKPWLNLKIESTIRWYSFHRPSDFGMKDKLLFKHFSSREQVSPSAIGACDLKSFIPDPQRKSIESFFEEQADCVCRLRPHPCIVLPFNHLQIRSLE